MQCRARRESVLGGFHEWFRRHLGDDDLVVSQMRRPGLDPESVGDLGKASPRSSDEIGKTPSLASPRVRSIPMASRQSGSVRRSPVSLPRAGARFRRSCAAFPRALSEQAERLLPRRLEAMTANTITSRALVGGARSHRAERRGLRPRGAHREDLRPRDRRPPPRHRKSRDHRGRANAALQSGRDERRRP